MRTLRAGCYYPSVPYTVRKSNGKIGFPQPRRLWGSRHRRKPVSPTAQHLQPGRIQAALALPRLHLNSVARPVGGIQLSRAGVALFSRGVLLFPNRWPPGQSRLCRANAPEPAPAVRFGSSVAAPRSIR